MPTFTDAVLMAAQSTLGWHEEPRGSNDGPAIRAWLAAVGVHEPAPWCVAWTYAMYQAAAEGLGVQNPHPRTAGSQRLYALAPVDVRTRVPGRGMVAAFAHLDDHGQRDGRGHVAIVKELKPGGLIVTVEGNTNSAGDRNGDSVAEHTWSWIDGHRGHLELLKFLDFPRLVAAAPPLVG